LAVLNVTLAVSYVTLAVPNVTLLFLTSPALAVFLMFQNPLILAQTAKRFIGKVSILKPNLT
jgi:hypothetical protein